MNPKIRQRLEVLRDNRILEFVGKESVRGNLEEKLNSSLLKAVATFR